MRIAIVAPGSQADPAIADRTLKLAQSLTRTFRSPSTRNVSSRPAISPAPTRSAPTRSSKPPTTRPSTPSGSRAAVTAPAASPCSRFTGSPTTRRKKTYLGYSDTGALLAGLYALRVPRTRARSDARGPQPRGRGGGDQAVARLSDDARSRDAGTGRVVRRRRPPPSTSRSAATSSARRSSPISRATC